LLQSRAANLEYTWVDNGTTLTEQTTTAFSVGGDAWDISTTVGANFLPSARAGAFLDVTPYLDQMPNFTKWISEDIMAACSIDGKIYGMAPYKDLAAWFNMFYNDTITAELGIADKIPADGWETMWDMIPVFKAAKEAQTKLGKGDEYLMINPQTLMNAWFHFDPLIGTMNTTIICTNVEGKQGFTDIKDVNQVFCPYFSSDFLKWAKQLKELSDLKISKGAKAGDTDPEFGKGQLWANSSLGNVVIDKNQYLASQGWTQTMTTQAGLYTTGYVNGACMAINAETKNPERAVAFIELLYGDEEILNLVHFGIEGADKDWTDADNDGVVEWGARNQDSANMNWKQWYGIRNILNIGIGKVLPGLPTNFSEVLKAANDAAAFAQNMGFIMDTDPIETERAACANVVAEYINRTIYPAGETDIDAMVKEFQDKLTANGIEDIIKEAQSQLDAWRQANGK